jgi:hypothetical protein
MGLLRDSPGLGATDYDKGLGPGPGTVHDLGPAAKVWTRAVDGLPKYKFYLGSSLDLQPRGGLLNPTASTIRKVFSLPHSWWL